MDILYLRNMKKILVIGGGLSATSLIAYLLDHAESENWQIILGDLDLKLAKKKLANHPKGLAIKFDICSLPDHLETLRQSDLVTSSTGS